MSRGPVELALEFGFDAAHHFLHADAHPSYQRMHGHSFTAEVVIVGMPDPHSGFVVDFGVLEAATAALRAELDHALLNEIPGLAVPSLENIAAWIWERLRPQFPGLARVVVRRPSCRQSCTYAGEAACPQSEAGSDGTMGAAGAAGVRPQKAAIASK